MENLQKKIRRLEAELEKRAGSKNVKDDAKVWTSTLLHDAGLFRSFSVDL